VPNLLTQGRILALQGQHEPALELVEEAAQLESANKDVFGLKKVLLEKLNRMDEAKQAFESYQVFSRASRAPAAAKPAKAATVTETGEE
jgi:Flp pilus assembly protein TadD